MTAEISQAIRFGTMLRNWRRHNNLKQTSLAHLLGVSQPAIARWEKGVDTPSPTLCRRIRDLMQRTSNSELAMQRVLTERLQIIRGLFDFEDMSMVAVSLGFREKWPEFSDFMGVSMRDQLVNEAAIVNNDRNLRADILDGGIGLITGVSVRHSSVQVDRAIRHKWHASFRRFGSRIFCDMIYEPCAQDIQPGLLDVVRFDEVADLVIGNGPDGETA